MSKNTAKTPISKMSNQPSVTLTFSADEMTHPILFIKALISQGVDLQFQLFWLFWNIYSASPIRRSLALGETPNYESALAKYAESLKSPKHKTQDEVWESIRTYESSKQRKAITPNVSATIAPMPIVVAKTAIVETSQTLKSWLKSEYLLTSEHAIESVFNALADSAHGEPFDMKNRAEDSFRKTTPLGESSPAFKRMLKAMRYAITTEHANQRARLYTDAINAPIVSAESIAPIASVASVADSSLQFAEYQAFLAWQAMKALATK